MRSKMGIAAVLVAVLIVTGCDDCTERLVRGPAEGGVAGGVIAGRAHAPSAAEVPRFMI